jgi:hypothetical protein
MAMTDKQRKSLDRHIDRVLARRGDGDKELSLYIRVAESRIYHGKPMHKALLKEVIFLRMLDLHEGDTRIPKGTPWSKNHLQYEGWTYASQEYLANRVGSKDPSYVGEVLRQMRDDGYIKIRFYRIPGRGSQKRNQYFADEAFINKRIIEFGLIEESDDNSDGEEVPQWLNPPSAVVKPSRPQGLSHSRRGGLSDFPQGLNPKKEALEYASEGDVRGRSSSTPPSGVADKPSLRSEEQKPKATPTSTPQKVERLVVDGLKPETKPAPKPSSRLAAYLDDEPEETTGGEPTPVTSSASRRVRQLPAKSAPSPPPGRAGGAMKPAEPRTVPCLFCTKNSRRSPDSDYCTRCWDEWKRTGVKPKAVIHGDGTPIQPAPFVPTPTQQAWGKAPAAESGRRV